jgi:2-succinyl-5-enolpyruvyl-6-hydroxy-3-cyclohexene-1-carboxylate synthase
MLSDKIIVRNLVEICAAKGIEHILISPGSRNAPLNIAFNEDGRFKCYSVPDERVAGFVALGIAQQTGKPAVITCTSGSAPLNYAPAISEAFYQQIPMLIITADRPQEWVDQGDGQTIRQANLFQNYIKKSYDLIAEPRNSNEIWFINRTISEAIDQTQHYGVQGPVHLNMPFNEPLYGVKDYSDVPLPKIVRTVNIEPQLPLEEWLFLKNSWEQADKILILTGLIPLEEKDKMTAFLSEITNKDKSVVVLTETTSNLTHNAFFPCIDRVIDAISEEEMTDFRPDLLVTVGHSIISKKIKALFRKYPAKNTWHIGLENYHLDTMQSLTHHIPMKATAFFDVFKNKISEKNTLFFEIWKNKNNQTQAAHTQFLATCEWSDMKAFDTLLAAVPAQSNLQMGNSSAVRYVQLFEQRPDLIYNSNRGVAGIDGCTSTAVGAAMVNQRPTTVITGDISFYYDSNAFWNFHLTDNLRVILINNGGGNIFRIIPGPDTSNQLEQFFETHHDLQAKHLARLFNLNYYEAESEFELKEKLSLFYEKQDNNRPAILEIKTPRFANDKVLKAYFRFLKSIHMIKN